LALQVTVNFRYVTRASLSPSEWTETVSIRENWSQKFRRSWGEISLPLTSSVTARNSATENQRGSTKLWSIGLLRETHLYYNYYLLCTWYFIPKGEEINQRDYNALSASRLVKKLGRRVSEWIAETDRFEALNGNWQTLKEKRRFTWIIGDRRKTMAQRRKKITTGLVYRPESFNSKWEKAIIWWKLQRTSPSVRPLLRPLSPLCKTLHSNRTPPRQLLLLLLLLLIFYYDKTNCENNNKTDDRHSSLTINIKLKYYHHCYYYVRHIMMNNVI